MSLPLLSPGEVSPPSMPMMKRPTMSISKAPAWRAQAISNAAEIAKTLLASSVCFLEEKGVFNEEARPRGCHWPVPPEAGSPWSPWPPLSV